MLEEMVCGMPLIIWLMTAIIILSWIGFGYIVFKLGIFPVLALVIAGNLLTFLSVNNPVRRVAENVFTYLYWVVYGTMVLIYVFVEWIRGMCVSTTNPKNHTES